MEINQIKEKDENKKEIKEVIHITKDDLYRFNLYLASLNKNLGMVVGGIVITCGVTGAIFPFKAFSVLILGLTRIYPTATQRLI